MSEIFQPIEAKGPHENLIALNISRNSFTYRDSLMLLLYKGMHYITELNRYLPVTLFVIPRQFMEAKNYCS